MIATLFATLSQAPALPPPTAQPRQAVHLKLYLDRHHFGPGKVTAADVAGAHQKDLAVQGKYHVRFLNYWFDARTGTVSCLVEAPSADAAIAAHKEAHGLIPEAIDEAVESL